MNQMEDTKIHFAHPAYIKGLIGLLLSVAWFVFVSQAPAVQALQMQGGLIGCFYSFT